MKTKLKEDDFGEYIVGSVSGGKEFMKLVGEHSDKDIEVSFNNATTIDVYGRTYSFAKGDSIDLYLNIERRRIAEAIAFKKKLERLSKLEAHDILEMITSVEFILK